MATGNARRFIELGVAPPLAKEIAAQITAGVGNFRRLGELGVTPAACKLLATGISGGGVTIAALTESGVVGQVAREFISQIGGGSALPSMASMSQRLRQPSTLINTGANSFIDNRIFDVAPTTATNFRPWFGGSSVNSSRVENTSVGGLPATYSYSLFTGISGTGLNQTVATQHIATFQDALNGTLVRGFFGQMIAPIWMNNGTAYVPATYADLVTAGGSIGFQLDGTTPCLNWVRGFIVAGDILKNGVTPASLTKGTTFMHQYNTFGPPSTSNALLAHVSGNNAPDRIKQAATLAAGGFNLKDWSALAGVGNANTTQPGILMLTAEGPAGVEIFECSGDSIDLGDPGDGYGSIGVAGAWANGMVRAAMAVAGYSTISTAVASTQPLQFTSNPQPCADWMGKWCSGGHHRYGTNNSASGNLVNECRNFNIQRRSVYGGRKFILEGDLIAKMLGGGASGTNPAITGFTSSGTTATAATATTPSNGAIILISDCPVAGYNGPIVVTSVNAGVSFTYELLNGGSNLGAGGAGVYTARAAVPITDVSPNIQQWINRTGGYSGVPLDTGAGDPNKGYSAYALTEGTLNPAPGLYPTRQRVIDGTHLAGNYSGGSYTAVANAANALAPLLPGLLERPAL